MLTDDIYESKEGSVFETDSFLEELNKPMIQYRKKVRQLEADHKKERAVLEQKIELLEIQLREFENREGNMKKMNQDILSTLETFDKKGGDSYLMNKVSEELALINREKLDEVKQQKSKMKVLRDKLQTNTLELTEKLEKSEERMRQMQLEHNNEKIRYERELDLEKRNLELLKKELEDEKRRSAKPRIDNNSENQIRILEEENRKLKIDHESEIQRLRGDFQKNLEELREIHNQEKTTIEDRLKKTKETLGQIEESNETKSVIENQLQSEVMSLKEQLAQAEIRYSEEIHALKADRDTALNKYGELEKRMEEFMNISQDNTDNEKNIISPKKSSVRSSSANRKSKKCHAGRIVDSNNSCEQEQSYSIASSIDIVPQLSALAYSEIQDICDSDRKKIISNRSHSTTKERSRVLLKEMSSGILNNKAPLRSSNESLRQDTQNQSSIASFVEFDHQKSVTTCTGDYAKRLEARNDYEDRALATEQDIHLNRASIHQPQVLQSRSLNQTPQDLGNYSYRLQGTSQLDSVLQSSIKPTKGQARYRAITEFDELDISCLNSIMDTDMNPLLKNSVNDQNRRPSNNSRNRTETSSKFSMNSEDIRRNFNSRLSSGNNARLQGRLRELTGATEISRVNSSLIVESSYQGKARSKGTTAAERRSFEKGIYDVMNGLLNIRSKIEKQQENLITAKNESLLHMHSRTRSYSNTGLQTESSMNVPNELLYVAPQTKPIPVTTNMYGDLDMSRRVSLGLSRNERMVVKDPSYMMVNLSFDGTRRATESGARGIQSDYKARNPTYNREKERSERMSYPNRHRNSLA